MAICLTLQKDYECGQDSYNKTVAIQKCGSYPFELALRFAGCNLKCGACFAKGYSWPAKYSSHYRVKCNIPVHRLLKEFSDLPVPPHGSYNWMRILGGEPLLSDEYTEYLFDFIKEIAKLDSAKFNNGIIIQTNGIYLGKGNTSLISKKLQELYEINPRTIIVVEVSIKGTNPEEFKLLTQSSSNLFPYNIQSYYNLRDLDLPNLRSVIIAGYGVSESYLLTNGTNPNSKITILFDENTPIFHPSIWSDEFNDLYNDFVNDWREFDPMFSKMPMYGIKDQFSYGWVKRAIREGREIYGWRWYDAKYVSNRSLEVERKFDDIVENFCLKDNQDYYSTLIRKGE